MAKGDYTQYRRQYQDISTSTGLASGSTGSPFTLLTAKNANYTIFVQRIIQSVTQFTSTGATGTFSDGATGAGIAQSAYGTGASVNAGVGNFEHDFGEAGCALTPGHNLVLTMTGTMPGMGIVIQAYQKLTQSTSFPLNSTGTAE